jgi:hypothetical protein
MSAGSLIGTAINFFVFAIASSICGKMFDMLITIMNGYPNLPMDAFNTVSNLHLIYIAGPFLYALALGYNHMINENNEFNQQV